MRLTDVVELPPQLWTLTEARRFVGELLDRAAVSSAIQDELAVAVTEACSNVVRHAPDSGYYRLTVDINDDRCLVEVRDAGPGFVPGVLRNPLLDEEGGRGLILMRALVNDLQLEQRRPGVTVTMIKNLRPPPDGTPPQDPGVHPEQRRPGRQPQCQGVQRRPAARL